VARWLRTQVMANFTARDPTGPPELIK